MGVMDGLTPEKLWEKVKRDWPIYMIADLSFWPFFQVLNFKFIPIKFQTLAIYTATLLYTVVMSAIESREVKDLIKSDAITKE